MRTISNTLAVAVASGLLLLAGCGDDDSSTDDTGQTSGDQDISGQDGGDAPTDSGGDGASDVVVTVDGTEYPMSIVQTCETERDEGRSSDVAMYGFAETGERVELTFSYQVAEESPTGTEQYYGSVGIASGEVSAQVTSDQPFDFLQGDRSTVAGSVTMESIVGSSSTPVEVDFTITCP